MADYTDLAKALRERAAWINFPNHGEEYPVREAKLMYDAADAIEQMNVPSEIAIEGLPAADVAPVRHGRWIWDEDGMDWGIGSWRCSECHTRPETWWQGERSSPLNKSGHYYCPNCGAKMDGGGE